MLLLDQEPQEAKAIRTKFTRDVEAMTQKSQSSREAVVALEANVRELTRANEKLESALVTQRKNSSKLEKYLEDQRARAGAIEREFKKYKEEHRLSSDRRIPISESEKLRLKALYRWEVSMSHGTSMHRLALD